MYPAVNKFISYHLLESFAHILITLQNHYHQTSLIKLARTKIEEVIIAFQIKILISDLILLIPHKYLLRIK